jgi:hypothetical protein
MLDPVSKQVFYPDYEVTVDDVFLKLASYLLAHDQHGHIYDLYELIHSSNMPSWLLDFTRPMSIHAAGHLSPYSTSAPWAKSVGRLSIYNSVLSVSGVEIDTLDFIDCIEDNEDDLKILSRFWKLEGLIQRCHPSESLPENAVPFLPSQCLIPFPL